MAPRVTALLTVYNGLPYLPQAVESLRAQTFADLELLVLDDGSTDGSREWLQRCADPRLRLVCHGANLGQAVCLNLGLSLARGEFIARMDQDDVCVPTRIERQLAAIARNPRTAAVGSCVRCIDAQGRGMGATGARIDDRGAFVGALLTFVTPAAHPSVLLRREAALAVGGYPEASAPCEDYALWCRLALAGHGMRVLPEPLLQVRQHGGQQSVASAARQRARFEAAHAAFVRALLGEDDAIDALTALLRMDASIGDGPTGEDVAPSHGGAPARVPAALDALNRLLQRAAERLALDAAEARSLDDRVAWWMARGAVRGAMQQQSASRHLYRFAMTHGRRTRRLPVAWTYPLAMAAWPLWSPAVRGAARRGATGAARRLSSLRCALSRARAEAPPASTSTAASTSSERPCA
jgi:hypothetical protein